LLTAFFYPRCEGDSSFAQPPGDIHRHFATLLAAKKETIIPFKHLQNEPPKQVIVPAQKIIEN
jgi:hypothetical protein